MKTSEETLGYARTPSIPDHLKATVVDLLSQAAINEQDIDCCWGKKKSPELADTLQSLAAWLERPPAVGWVRCTDEEPTLKDLYLAYRPDAPEDDQVATIYFDPYHTKWGGQYPVKAWMRKPEGPDREWLFGKN